MNTPSKRYVPNEYINKIVFRVPRRNNPYSISDHSLERAFDTWEEAHQWTVSMRRKRIESLENLLAAARKSLLKALKMKQPEEAA